MATVTPAHLAAQIVVEGCLPMIQEKVRGGLPVEGRLLSEAEKRERGMIDALTVNPQMSQTISYKIGRDEVLLDLDRSQASVWFSNADYDKAMGLLDMALKAQYPRAQQTEDRAHPDAEGMRVRLYTVELDPALRASIEVSYAAPGGVGRQFVVRVRAQITKDAHDKAIAAFKAMAQETKKH